MDVTATAPDVESRVAALEDELYEARQELAELRSRDALKTQFLSNISHDLRTPLTLLRLRAEALPETEERERMLGSIGDLQAMIEATLHLARDEATSEPTRRIDFAALVEAIVDDMQDAGMPVRLVGTDPVVLDAKPLALRRAIGNLIDNAIKYGETAEVEMRATSGMVRVVVEDRGPGIPAADRDLVFEPFHRLDPSRSRETGGVGLGLAIVRAVAAAHGGDIALSDRPGGGLRAELSLPRHRPIRSA